jgi:hypothetical protein
MVVSSDQQHNLGASVLRWSNSTNRQKKIKGITTENSLVYAAICTQTLVELCW